MSLLERIRSHLHLRRTGPLAADRKGQPTDLELQAATALLLLEAAYGDETYPWREHRTIVKGLEREFGLGRREVLALLDRAEEIRPPVVTLADVTRVLRERFDAAQRRRVLALLWQVIDADRVLEDWESAFAEHVARAVGLSAEEARAARGPQPKPAR